MSIEIKVPTLGESVTEATVAKWLKQVGDAVKQDEPLVERDLVEAPAPFSHLSRPGSCLESWKRASN